MTGEVRLDIVDGVAFITLDRPDKRNAVSAAMWEALGRHAHAIRDASGICAIVLRGTGGAFCAGADLTQVKAADGSEAAGYRASAEPAMRVFTELPQPKIAHIDGACYGAGCALALACDIRVCTPRSAFAIPALTHGVAYEPAHLRRLVHAVGAGAAGLLLYGAQRWDGHEAAARRLADVCTEDAVAAIAPILTTLRAADGAVATATAHAIRATQPA